MRKRIKRCKIRSSKINKQGVCTWIECPSNKAKEQEIKEKEIKDEAKQ